MAASEDDPHDPRDLVRGLRSLGPSLESLRTEQASMGNEVAGVKSDVRRMRDDVDRLDRIVLVGNGHESLVTRVAMLEREHGERKAAGARRWEVWLAIAGAVVALFKDWIAAALKLGGP